MTEAELIPGARLKVRQATSAISRVTVDVAIEIVWCDGENVHYRRNGSAVMQTPMGRFLEIVNNQPPERH